MISAVEDLPIDDGRPSTRAGVDASIAIPLLLVHLVGLGLAPFTFTREGLVACVMLYLFTGFGVTAGAHRLFTHRTFTPAPIVRELLALAFLMSAQGSIHRWVRDHGIHHRYSDQPSDPHSPAVHGLSGAHLGWLWQKPPSRSEERALYARWTRGLDPGRVGRFFQSGARLAALHLGAIVIAYAMGAFLEAGFSADALLRGHHTGVSLIVWGIFLRIVLVLHSTCAVNSAAHRWGTRRHPTRDGSTNNWLVAILALGEGWHNNHHHRPAAANNGFFAWWEVDLTFLLLLALGAVGLLHDLKVYDARRQRTIVWFASPS